METEPSEIVERGDDASSSHHGERPLMAEKMALYRAALKGNWDAAEELIRGKPSLINTPITQRRETALHIAVIEGHRHFVTKLLAKMTVDDVNMQNENGCTALCFAAAAGHTPIARIMVEKSASLPTIRGENAEVAPLSMAALQGFVEMANYLYPLSNFGSWTDEEKIELLTTAIDSELYGLAVKIVGEHVSLAIAKDGNDETPLLVLARNPSAIRCNNRQGKLDKIMRYVPCMKSKIHDNNPEDDAYSLLECLWNYIETMREADIEAAQRMDTTKLFFVAAECGNDEFLVRLLRKDHNFLYNINRSRHSIFHIAVLHRYVSVFNLMFEMVGTKDLIATYIDTDGNNILHLAGKLAPQNQLNCIPGAALQMQREVLWFKEVEKLVPPSYKNMKNNDGQTPHELFLAAHADLIKEGEKLMKQTAKACMLVTILIATVVFTTAFTVPGGYNNTTGHPILENKRFFKVFPVSEAVATLSSLISTLMFLSIVTSRYSDDDFLRTLPLFLVVGVASLFVSIVAMMVAFCSCLLFFEHGWTELTLLLGFFASVPTMFVVLKYPLLVAILRCTYSCTWLFRSYNRLQS